MRLSQVSRLSARLLVLCPTWCLSCPSSLCHPDLRLPLWSRRFGRSRLDIPERPVHGQQPDVPVTTRPGEESDPPPGTLDEEAGRTCSPIHLRGSDPVAGGQTNQPRLTGSLISPGTSSGKSRTWMVEQTDIGGVLLILSVPLILCLLFFQIPLNLPCSVTLQPGPEDTGKVRTSLVGSKPLGSGRTTGVLCVQACGVDFEVNAFCAENPEEKIHKR